MNFDIFQGVEARCGGGISKRRNRKVPDAISRQVSELYVTWNPSSRRLFFGKSIRGIDYAPFFTYLENQDTNREKFASTREASSIRTSDRD